MAFKRPCEQSLACYWQGISACYATHTFKEFNGLKVPYYPDQKDVPQEVCEREYIPNEDGSRRNIVAMKDRQRRGKEKIEGQGELL
jgi:hypothetical protein